MGVVAQSSLTSDEERLLGHYRRLKKYHHDFKFEIFGCFKSGHRQIHLKPCPYEILILEELEEVFDAID